MSYPEAAACTSRPRLFFGPEGETDVPRKLRERLAKAICQDCPVRDECLADAITNDIRHGVWGGSGEKERQMYLGRLRKQRAKAAAS